MASRRQPNLSIETMEETDPDVAEVIERLDPKKHSVLDRSRRFGEIQSNSGSFHGAHYSQNDRFGIERFFDNEGVRIRVPDEPEDGARPPSSAKGKAKAVPMVAREIREAVASAAASAGEATVVGDVNLTAWGCQKEQYPWTMVRKAIEERFSKVCINPAEALDFLIHEGVLTPQMLRAAGVQLTNDV